MDLSSASKCCVGRNVYVSGERDSSRDRDGDGDWVGGQDGAWVRADLEASDAVPDGGGGVESFAVKGDGAEWVGDTGGSCRDGSRLPSSSMEE